MGENPSTGGNAKARLGIDASRAIASASISTAQSAVAIRRFISICIRAPLFVKFALHSRCIRIAQTLVVARGRLTIRARPCEQ
jgi:hypothetical protein